MEVTTREAASVLGVTQGRVRALIAAGTLRARRVGTQWLIDADSVDHQAALSAARATGRTMATRVAWAVGDLLDGGSAAWLSSAERSRLRKRIGTARRSEVLQRWLASRASRVLRFHVGESDLEALLSDEAVVRTGVSAALAHGVGLSSGGDGAAYVTREAADRLASQFFLIEARSGNLTLRLVDHDLHLRSARTVDNHRVAPRVIVGVDLADDSDVRTSGAGRELLESALAEHQGR
ncbi:MAG: excisionase family DNA-binding protein [Actinomycetales bacterium]|nr:excisionase family DNA-binding protein [Actinomycetales bacterium]